MEEAIVRSYKFKNGDIYNVFEGNNPNLGEIGLRYLVINYHDAIDFSITGFRMWESYFHHNSGAVVTIMGGAEDNALNMVGLRSQIANTVKVFRKRFGNLKKVDTLQAMVN